MSAHRDPLAEPFRSTDAGPIPQAGNKAAPMLTAEDARTLVCAAVSRAMLGDDVAPMARVHEEHVERATGSPRLGRLWAVVADGERDPLTLARRSGLEPASLAKMIDAPERHLFTIGAAVERLERDARRYRATELAEKLPGRIMAGLGAGTLEELRALLAETHGGPTIPHANLRGWREESEPDWLVRGFVTRAGLALLSASAKTGKSFSLLDLALRLASGQGGLWLGHFAIAPAPQAVLYVDIENGESRMRRRIRALVEGGSITPTQADEALDRLHVVAVPESPASLVLDGRLAAWLDAQPCALVIADPLRPLLPPGSDENSADAGRTLDALRSICAPRGAACIVADHDGKDGNAARGHSSKRDSPDMLWHLTRASSSDPSLLKLHADFTREDTPERTVKFRLDHVGDDGVRFVAASGDARPLQDRVIDLLRDGVIECREYRQAEIAKELDADRRRVSEVVRELVRAGLVRLRGDVLELGADER